MSRIVGTLVIDFETGADITEEQFKLFKKKINNIVDQMEGEIYGIANECGFEAYSVNPVVLDAIDCEF